MRNQAIIWFIDSANAARIVRYGSSKPHLRAIAVQIFDLCLDLHIDLNIDWLPRTENQKADYLSKIVDPDDWALGRKYFAELDKLWGPHTIDRFSADYNKKLPCFKSRFWNPCVNVQLVVR